MPDSPAPPLKLRGIVTPLVTPLQDYNTLDREGTVRLLEHVISGGVSGIFILGTTGEAPSLSYALRREFVRLVCERTQARIPVLVGVTDTSFVESVELGRVAADAGADALVLSTPYYFPAGQTELIRYITHIVEQLSLPVMLYNMPSLTKVWFDIESLKHVANIDRIIGVKDSSGDMEYFQQVVRLKQRRPDWSVLIGPEHLLVAAMRCGGDGGVHGGSNCFPELFSGLYQAVLDDNDADIAQRMARVNKLQEIYEVGKYASRFIKATKCVLSLKGICSDRLAEPFNHFLPPERERVQTILNELSNL